MINPNMEYFHTLTSEIFNNLLPSELPLSKPFYGDKSHDYDIQIGYFSWDQTIEQFEYSASLAEIFNISEDRIIHSPHDLFPYIHPEDIRLVRQSGFLSFDYPSDTPDHQPVLFRLISSEHTKLLYGKKEQLKIIQQNQQVSHKFIWMVHDMTKLFSLRYSLAIEKEAAIAQQKKFVSLISHEIRTPINGIIGMVHLLKEVQEIQDIHNSIDILQESSYSLLSLVDNVLDFAKCIRSELSLEKKPVYFPNILREITLEYLPKAQHKNLSLLLTLPDTNPPLTYGDPNRLKEIIRNLLKNAIKFTHQGYIQVSLEVMNSTNREDKLNIHISISDTGIGIPKEIQEKIFLPFTQAEDNASRNYDGSGLGLSITKEIIQAMGGQITVESEPEQGSTFHLHLPMDICFEELTHSDIDPIPIPPIQKEMYHAIKGVRILYVEDVEANRRYLQMLAKSRGWRIDIAENGYEALQKVVTKDYDMIFMDIMMPGMDGYETTQKIRNYTTPYFKHLPIIALTASITIPNDERYVEAKMNDYIIKPATPSIIEQKVFTYTMQFCKKIISWRPEINFEPLLNNFSDDLDDYETLLRIMLREFQTNKELLIPALHNKDLPILKDVRHKLVGSLLAMDQKDLSNYFQAIRLLTQDVRFDAEYLAHHIDETFELLIEKVEAQIKGIET